MSYGKLVIVGDSSFIKKTFNVGYHITLNFPTKTDPSSINNTKNMITKYIENAR